MPTRPVTAEQQQEALEAQKKHGGTAGAARHLGISESTLRNRIAGGKGKSGPVDALPEGHSIRGVSTLYGPEGEVKGQWVKTREDVNRAERALQEAAEALKEGIPRTPSVSGPKSVSEDLAACYVLSDYHLGQLSWGDETGDDWDTDIAEEMLDRWFAEAIKSAPKAHTAILAQLGDFLHWDGMDAITPTSGHLLDADTRFQRLVRVVIRSLRRVVKRLLKKHQHVHILMCEGNHDIASSVWLRELFAAFYENEPRVTVDVSPAPYYCVEWGKTSLFFHHGHKSRLAEVSRIFAGMFRDVFGRTTYSYAHTGHLHHVASKEDSLMVVEQHPTIAAKDAHSARGGYGSKRGATVIVYHKEYGEVGRSTIRPEMVA